MDFGAFLAERLQHTEDKFRTHYETLPNYTALDLATQQRTFATFAYKEITELLAKTTLDPNVDIVQTNTKILDLVMDQNSAIFGLVCADLILAWNYSVCIEEFGRLILPNPAKNSESMPEDISFRAFYSDTKYAYWHPNQQYFPEQIVTVNKKAYQCLKQHVSDDKKFLQLVMTIFTTRKTTSKLLKKTP